MHKLLSALVLLSVSGCVAPKEYYTQTETGPHGVVNVKKIYYTPEELAQRQEADRYANSRPGDQQMRAIEVNWPKLTNEEKTTIMKTVEDMARGR